MEKDITPQGKFDEYLAESVGSSPTCQVMYRIKDIGAACDLDRNIQEILFPGNFILGNFLLGNFDTPGKVVAPKDLSWIRLPPKLCTPGKDRRQDQGAGGELMIANSSPPNICLLRSCAPNICSYRAEELRGEHLPGLSSIFKKILSKNFFKKG